MTSKIKLASRTRGNMDDPAGQEIKRIWGDMEVVDSEKELRVFIAPEDVAKATRKDPAYCVFAQACRRQFHATKVLFYRSVAYIDLPFEGRRRVERFLMPDKMRDLVESFDRGETKIPQDGFVLKAPTPSNTLNNTAKKSSEDRLRAKRRMLEGQSAEVRKKSPGLGQGKGKFRDKPLVMDLAVRSGIGAVHFTHRPKANP